MSWPGRAAVATLVLLAAAAGCSTTTTGGERTSSSRAGTTTTTTLPTPIEIDGTQPTGTMSFLGPVLRVTVEPVPAGQTVPEPAAGGAPKKGQVAATGVTIAYRQLGSGPDILLVMGQAGSLSWWQPDFLQAMAQNFRVTIFDLPGVGYSGDDAGGAPSIGRYSDVTAGLADALGLRHPVLLGWGMGAEVALEVLLRHAGLAARAVLADTSIGGTSAVGTPPTVATALASAGSTTAFLASLLFPGDASAERAAWLLGTRAQTPDDVVPSALTAEAAAQAGWWQAGATPLQLTRITDPVMVIWGTDDAVFPAVDSSALAASVPKDTVLTLPGDGYGALFQSEPAVVPAITAFAQAGAS